MSAEALLRFEGRTAIVTGAGRGIGRAHALALAARGAAVIVNDAGVTPEGTGVDQGPAEAVAAEIRAAGGQAVASFDPVDTVAGADNIVAAAIEAFGGIDIVINNAGILTAHAVPPAAPTTSRPTSTSTWSAASTSRARPGRTWRREDAGAS
jgi:NAD(P)-dependent dehydrogenase (short-subunit alcohol dehydrogenase family)